MIGKRKAVAMNKDIWHSKDEIPSKESRVFWASGNIVYGGRFDTYYKCFCGPASQFVDLKSVSCWAYIDDLLSLETENKSLSDKIGKMKTELDHIRKALDVAVDALKLFYSGQYTSQPDAYGLKIDASCLAHTTLAEIKTALEQKDK